MFLHLGAERVVPINKIIGIFDIENTTVSKITKQFLQIASEEDLVESLTEDMPKSFILIEFNNTYKVVLSPISTGTLIKRLEQPLSE
jgi:hypothetical protein